MKLAHCSSSLLQEEKGTLLAKLRQEASCRDSAAALGQHQPALPTDAAPQHAQHAQAPLSNDLQQTSAVHQDAAALRGAETASSSSSEGAANRQKGSAGMVLRPCHVWQVLRRSSRVLVLRQGWHVLLTLCFCVRSRHFNAVVVSCLAGALLCVTRTIYHNKVFGLDHILNIMARMSPHLESWSDPAFAWYWINQGRLNKKLSVFSGEYTSFPLTHCSCTNMDVPERE